MTVPTPTAARPDRASSLARRRAAPDQGYRQDSSSDEFPHRVSERAETAPSPTDRQALRTR